MREIEFRAWDSIHNKWYDIVNTKFIDDGNGENTLVLDFENESIIWEQFTGLRDKNGKKIFEGDIVKCYGMFPRIGRCEYNYDGYIVKWNEGGYSRIDWSECEIIGNVHENPELIK